MTLDDFDDVLSDHNALNLHKITKVDHSIIYGTRTDLASLTTDSGQSFLFSNMHEPLELENMEHGDTYQLFDATELSSTTYNLVNTNTVARYVALPSITALTPDIPESGDYFEDEYTVNFIHTPYIDDIYACIELVCDNEGVVITKEDTFEFTIDLTQATFEDNTLLTFTYTDVDDKSRAYEGTGVTGTFTMNVIKSTMTSIDTTFDFTELSESCPVIKATVTYEPTDARGEIEVSCDSSLIEIEDNEDGTYTITYSDLDSFPYDINSVVLTVKSVYDGETILSETYNITVSKTIYVSSSEDYSDDE